MLDRLSPPPPADLPGLSDQNPQLLSPVLQAGSLPLRHLGNPHLENHKCTKSSCSAYPALSPPLSSLELSLLRLLSFTPVSGSLPSACFYLVRTPYFCFPLALRLSPQSSPASRTLVCPWTRLCTPLGCVCFFSNPP